MKICVVGIAPIPEDYLENALQGMKQACAPSLHEATELFLRVPTKGPLVMPENLFDYRNNYFQHMVKHEVIETIIQADREGFDAIVVNCFDDPGVLEVQSVVSTPVFGLSQASFHFACQLGDKFGAIVPDMPGQVAFVQGQIDAMGLSHRCINRGVRSEPKVFTESFAEALAEPGAMIGRIESLGRELVSDGADVVVVACGGLGQICGQLNFHSLDINGASVPLVVPLPLAIKQAEMMVELSGAHKIPIPTRAHNARQLDADNLTRIRKGFDVE